VPNCENKHGLVVAPYANPCWYEESSQAPKEGHILGLMNVAFEKDMPYGACQADKQVGAQHRAKNIMATKRPLEMLHMDLFGPIANISIGGNKYSLVIIDDYSRFTWVFFLQDKCETREVLKKFLKWAKN
jgi:hypothetical protein